MNRLDRAIPLFEQVLEKVRIVLGEDRPETLATMNNLARAFRATGQLDRAIPLLEQTLERKKKKLPPNHPSTLLTMDNLAEAYIAADRRADGLALYEQTLKLRKAKLSAEHPDTMGTQGRLAAAYRSAGRPGDAEVLWNELLAIRQKKSPDDWTTFETMSLLGGVMTDQKKYAEAEPLLLKGYEGMNQREAKRPPQAGPRQVNAVQRLVDLYVAWDKKDKADEWRKKLEMQKEAEKKPPASKPKP
jgi:tetratricopeptide (TPR) repeat protein